MRCIASGNRGTEGRVAAEIRVQLPWLLAPRFTAGMPLPRWGWRGSVTGPGFSVTGDTDDAGHGVHMGDAFGGFGLGVGYIPWHLSFDLGSLANQALGEPVLHKGIDSAWLLSVSWDQVP